MFSRPIRFRPATFPLFTLLAVGLACAFSLRAQQPPVATPIDATQENTTLGLFDPTFRAPVTNLPTAVLAFPDGSVLVAAPQAFVTAAGRTTYGIARLARDGSVDPAFQATLGTEGGVTRLIAQPDGRVVVGGTFTQVNGTAAAGLVRLRADGTLDAGFMPDPALRDAVWPPILLADGRWLTAALTQDAAGNRTVTLARFLADGARDPAFAAPPLAAAFAAPAGIFANSVNFADLLATRDDLGRVYLAAPFGVSGTATLAWQGGRSLLFRLLPDGTRDPAFAPRAIAELSHLLATRRGLVCRSVDAAWNRPTYSKYLVTISRLTFDGADDPSFAPTTLDDAGLTPSLVFPSYDYVSIIADHDGAVYADIALRLGRRGLVRLAPDGKRDLDFSAEWNALVEPVAVLPEGKILATGGVRAADGSTSSLHRLVPDRAAARTHLGNVSIRTRAGTGSATLILGFTATAGEKRVLLRGAGPALRALGVDAALADPQLALLAGETLLAANDDWPAALAPVAAGVGAFPFAPGSRDAALLTPLAARGHTVHVAGAAATEGIALAELYDTDPAPADAAAPRLTNFSARARVGPGEDVLVAGFHVTGPNTRTLLIRAVGPGLEPFGVAPRLDDPRLVLYRGTTMIAANATWPSTDSFESRRIKNAAATAGAFALANGSRDAVLLVTLPPGAYTAQVTSSANLRGIALLEVYELP